MSKDTVFELFDVPDAGRDEVVEEVSPDDARAKPVYYAYCLTENKRVGLFTFEQKEASNAANYHAEKTKHSTQVKTK